METIKSGATFCVGLFIIGAAIGIVVVGYQAVIYLSSLAFG